jgi:hypothetical protein
MIKMYSDGEDSRVKYSLSVCRDKSYEPLEIRNMKQEIQRFIYGQLDLIQEYINQEIEIEKLGHSSNMWVFIKSLLKNLWLNLDVDVDEKEKKVYAEKITDMGYILAIIEQHAKLFALFDVVGLSGKEWLLMNADLKEIQIIVFASDTYKKSDILDKMSTAIRTAKQKGWKGKIYYTRCDEEVNLEV